MSKAQMGQILHGTFHTPPDEGGGGIPSLAEALSGAGIGSPDAGGVPSFRPVANSQYLEKGWSPQGATAVATPVANQAVDNHLHDEWRPERIVIPQDAPIVQDQQQQAAPEGAQQQAPLQTQAAPQQAAADPFEALRAQYIAMQQSPDRTIRNMGIRKMAELERELSVDEEYGDDTYDPYAAPAQQAIQPQLQADPEPTIEDIQYQFLVEAEQAVIAELMATNPEMIGYVDEDGQPILDANGNYRLRPRWNENVSIRNAVNQKATIAMSKWESEQALKMMREQQEAAKRQQAQYREQQIVQQGRMNLARTIASIVPDVVVDHNGRRVVPHEVITVVEAFAHRVLEKNPRIPQKALFTRATQEFIRFKSSLGGKSPAVAATQQTIPSAPSAPTSAAQAQQAQVYKAPQQREVPPTPTNGIPASFYNAGEAQKEVDYWSMNEKDRINKPITAFLPRRAPQ